MRSPTASPASSAALPDSTSPMTGGGAGSPTMVNSADQSDDGEQEVGERAGGDDGRLLLQRLVLKGDGALVRGQRRPLVLAP